MQIKKLRQLQLWAAGVLAGIMVLMSAAGSVMAQNANSALDELQLSLPKSGPSWS